MFIVLEKFLKLNNFSRVITDFEDYYQSHPNFPSLFALTDTFSFLNIENVAARVDKDQYEELPDSFLGYVENEKKGINLALIHKINGAVEVTFEGEKPEKLTINLFKQKWNGVVVAIEPQEARVREVTFSRSFSLLAFVLIAVGVFVVFNRNNFTIFPVIAYSVYMLGALISVSIIREKLNKNPSEASKICSIGSNTSCDSVIKSDHAQLTRWIDFSDLGILFYGSAVLTMIINPESFRFINSISILAIPLIIYSIWIQRVELKTWCVLCLGLSGLLLVQSVWALFSGVVFTTAITQIILIAIVVSFAWFFLRNYLLKNVNLAKDNLDLLRFKRNFEVFQFLQKPINVSTTEIVEGKIVLGSSSNQVNVSVIISPSCGHCHAAFIDVMDLYKENADRVKVEFYYNLNPENLENPYLGIARTILQIAKMAPEYCIEALSDWHVNHMDKAEWLDKWKQSEIHPEIDVWLKEQYEWCIQNEFNYTPVKIVNDSELSEYYSVEELKYFMSELNGVEEMD
ncbi:thioredoxin domain-containing protein [bacterium]|nr:thioredoxin domain-containing protein [bacterium]